MFFNSFQVLIYLLLVERQHLPLSLGAEPMFLIFYPDLVPVDLDAVEVRRLGRREVVGRALVLILTESGVALAQFLD